MATWLELKSRAYSVHCDTIGGHYIEHKATGLSTPWNCGIAGQEYLADLKRAKRCRAAIFNSMCAEHFAEGATVYNRAGECGHMHKGQWVKD